MKFKEPLTGRRFSRLLVLDKKFRDKSKKNHWLCRCDCGNEKYVMTGSLTSGKTTSCGCYQKEKSAEALRKTSYRHGGAKTRLYGIWGSMHQRCLNVEDGHYKDYGGRGIKIYKRWITDFRSFRNWSLRNGYNDSLTIDRIDNDGNYEPTNCRWIPRAQQARNKRNNVIYKGETATEASKRLKLSPTTVHKRIENGWSLELAFSEPKQHVNY